MQDGIILHEEGGEVDFASLRLPAELAVEGRADGEGGEEEAEVEGAAELTSLESLDASCADGVGTDGGAGAPCNGHLLPARRRLALAPFDDLHHIAIGQALAQRAFATIDAGADGGVAELGMHGEGEIERGRSARQRDHDI